VSRREDIDNAIWSDPDFEALSLEATVLYLWSFTNPRCGMAGIYKVSRRGMTESKVPAERLDAALAELAEAGFLFYEDGVLFVRSRAKHLRQKTVQIAKSIRSDVAKLPVGHPLRVMFLEVYQGSSWLRDYLSTDALLTVTEGSAEGQAVQPPRAISSTLNRRSVDRLGKGQRQGKGQGPSREGSGEGPDWGVWARANLPDLPADLVAVVAGRMAPNRPVMNPDEVRSAVLARHPHLRGDAA
jgi:hypothetical protein